jgi:hypothetical protein
MLSKNKLFDSLRCVKIRYVGDSETTEHHLHLNDVHDFAAALIKLHISPGINIYTGTKTKEIELIEVLYPHYGKYWWTSPTLEDDDKAVEVISGWLHDEYIYMSPSVNDDHLFEMYQDHVANSTAATGEECTDKFENENKPYIADDYKKYFKLK